MNKPRLAENEGDLWKAAAAAHLKWWSLGYYIEMDTLGEGIYSFDKDGQIIRMHKVGNVPTYERPRRLHELDKAFATDTVQITAKRMGKSAFSGDSYPDHLLHSCSGMSFKTKSDFIKGGV